MLALGPGGIMHMFALGEAMRLGSDWVYLSTPLLLIGAASCAWLLQIKLGTTGLAVGAGLSVVAFGGAFFNLNKTITERARWQASSRELSDTDRFCRGELKPNAKALPYQPGAANPTVFFGPTSANLYDSKFNVFEPKEYQIENAAMVVCVSDKNVLVEKCTGYDQGAVVDRERVDSFIKVVAIETGALVFEKSFEGSAPRACANTEKFYGKSLETLIVGEPAKYDLIAELGPLLKH